MILTENQDLLAERFPDLWGVLKEFSDQPDLLANYQVHPSKSSAPTLTVACNGQEIYLHSKYDPVNEAKQFIEQFEDIDRYHHIFFYGIGLGYHIEYLMQHNPDKQFTIFEPNPAILYQYLSVKRLADLPLKNLEHIYLDLDTEQTKSFLIHYANLLLEDVLFVFLPSYQRLFQEKYRSFQQLFLKIIKDKKQNLAANLLYARKWTVNSIKNFMEVLKTPDIIDNYKGQFKDQPAIIVAAGPSLNDEIENLKHIKANNLAYVFAVSSGLVPLLTNDLLPDAVLAYDPNDTFCVFQKMVDQQITDVPLIFGSTIGSIVPQHYPGPMMHFFINQDRVAPYYLRFTDGNPITALHDAPTITIIAVQLLIQLGFDPIIFVGQNLAYRNNQSRAVGIDYYQFENNAAALKELFPVASVDGEQVLTNQTFNLMRENLELVIKGFPDTEFINCTNGGAKIEGTKFIPLEQLIATRLSKRLEKTDWSQCQTDCYDPAYLQQQARLMENDLSKLEQLFKLADESFRKLKIAMSQNNLTQLNREITVFEQLLLELQANSFFKVFLKSLKRVEFEFLVKIVHHQVQKAPPKVKARQVLDKFGKFFDGCRYEMQTILPLYHDFNQSIVQYIETVATKT